MGPDLHDWGHDGGDGLDLRGFQAAQPAKGGTSMIKGLYSAFSAMESAWRYQDVLANNVANANTAGFKREVASNQSFADVLLSQQTPIPAPIAARIQDIVGQIGTGDFIANFQTDFASGALQPTGNSLDLALDQGFFTVQTPDGSAYYTRDGRFSRDGNGDLVTSAGYYVLGADGAPINLAPGDVTVDAAGGLSVAGQPAGQLQILDFTPNQLTRAGEAYFTASEPGTPVQGGVRSGFLEASNTSMVEEMTSLLAVQRTYQANQAVLAKLDGTLDSAAGQIGQFGR
jgi:flagellar basal-body rod protein FlgG